MRSLQTLNETVWYRALKVIYVGFWMLALIAVLAMVYDSYQPKINHSLSRVVCPNEKSSSLEEMGIILTEGNLTADAKEQVRVFCYGELSPLIPNPNNGRIQMTREQFRQRYGYEVGAAPQYELSLAYSWYWTGLIKNFLIAILITALFFEMGRRVFYYVVLGSVFPQKTRRNTKHKVPSLTKSN